MTIFNEELILFLQNTFAYGALKKGGSWGGPDCAKAVPIETHIIESTSFMVGWIALYYIFRLDKYVSSVVKRIDKELSVVSVSPTVRVFEIILGCIQFGMYLQIVYYKLNIFSLVNLIQPCHVILLLQSFALFSTGSTGVLLSSFMLPSLTGTLSAMLFPATEGLDQPYEMQAYWTQHYIIQSVPLYLLLRRDGLALRISNWKSIFIGVLVLGVLHFSLYEIIDVILSVNVEFMLCPTPEMETIFQHLPKWLLLPSYRTTLTVMVCIVGPTISLIYLFMGWTIRRLFGFKTKVHSA